MKYFDWRTTTNTLIRNLCCCFCKSRDQKGDGWERAALWLPSCSLCCWEGFTESWAVSWQLSPCQVTAQSCSYPPYLPTVALNQFSWGLLWLFTVVFTSMWCLLSGKKPKISSFSFYRVSSASSLPELHVGVQYRTFFSFRVETFRFN